MFSRTRKPQHPPIFLQAQGFEKRYFSENIRRFFGQNVAWQETVDMNTGREGFEIQADLHQRVSERIIARIRQECQRAYEQLLSDQRRNSSSSQPGAPAAFNWHYPHVPDVSAAMRDVNFSPVPDLDDLDMSYSPLDDNYNYDNSTFNIAYYYPGYASAAALAAPPLRSTSYHTYDPPDERRARSAPCSPVVDPISFSPAEHYVYANVPDLAYEDDSETYSARDNSIWQPDGGYYYHGGMEEKIPEVRVHRVPTLPYHKLGGTSTLRHSRSADSLGQFWPGDVPFHFGGEQEDRFVDSPQAID